jgi:hypothetical protein
MAADLPSRLTEPGQLLNAYIATGTGPALAALVTALAAAKQALLAAAPAHQLLSTHQAIDLLRSPAVVVAVTSAANGEAVDMAAVATAACLAKQQALERRPQLSPYPQVYPYGPPPLGRACRSCKVNTSAKDCWAGCCGSCCMGPCARHGRDERH